MAGEFKRACLWSFWVANLLIDVVYVIMAWATADNLTRMSVNVQIPSTWKEAQSAAKDMIVSNNVWRAPIASCALGGLMVVLFNLMSCIVLIRKSIVKNGPGFGYGFVVAWAFVMAFFTLMCGLVIEGFKNVVSGELEPQTNWTSVMTGAFRGTYVLSYIVAVMFMLFFLILLIFQGAVTKELGIYEHMQQQKRLLEMNALAAGGPLGPTLQGGPI